MINTFGKLIIPKGFILYHTSSKPFIIEFYKNNLTLNCTFHPSEGKELEYITKIILKKESLLLFAIDFINKDEQISIPIAGMKEILKYDIYRQKLKLLTNYENFCFDIINNNNLDGLIDMNIIRDGQLEIILINNLNNYDFQTELLKKDWKREGMNYNNSIVLQKIWGKNYPIYFNKNIILNINEKYKYHIELLLQNIENKKYKYNKSLFILLRDCQKIFNKGFYIFYI